MRALVAVGHAVCSGRADVAAQQREDNRQMGMRA
jgi:hypothetical protein